MNATEMMRAQARLLQDFSNFSEVLSGVTAMLWLPGLRQKFDGPRRIVGVRPLVVTMEVSESAGLALSGAIAFPREGRMRYETIFRYEFTQPMALNARGETLSAKKDVLAARGLELLSALNNFGAKRLHSKRPVRPFAPWHPHLLIPFNLGEEVLDDAKLSQLACEMSPELWETYRNTLAQELVDRTTIAGTTLVDARIVPDEIVKTAIDQKLCWEDYRPVLGVWATNPARRLKSMFNPASAILERHGVTDVGAMTQDTLDAVMAAFRVAVPLGERLTDTEILDALCAPSQSVKCAAGVDGCDPDRVVAAMLDVAGGQRRTSLATNADILAAAHNPDAPLVLSRMSRTQIVSTDALHDLPAPYCGHFLPAIGWAPSRMAAKEQLA